MTYAGDPSVCSHRRDNALLRQELTTDGHQSGRPLLPLFPGYLVCFCESPRVPGRLPESVPEVIYTIPPSSPVYHVTYVTQVTNPDGTVQSSYTSGYTGAYVMSSLVGRRCPYGTGYYYPSYVYVYPAYGYPYYYPPPYTYGYWHITIHPREPMACLRRCTVRTARQREPLRITPTQGHTRGPPRFPRPMAAQQPGGHTTHIPGRLPPPGRVPMLTPRGAVPWSQREERPPTPSTIPTEKGTVGSVKTSTGGKAVGVSTEHGKTAVARPGAETCMPATTAMSTRKRIPAGRNMKTEAGTACRSLHL